VLRVLDRASVQLDFRALGFSPEDQSAFRGVLNKPNGILLVTGPTGSGKTTTLYASLTELNAPDTKIFTYEDAIEYHLPGINQVQVKPHINLTFAHVLRSILRQDPDIIMVGEIRDMETAEIAIQASLTSI
jgi:general secretion pathway protein E